MAWTSLIIKIDNLNVESVSDYLIELGAVSATIQNSHLNESDEELIFGEPHDGPAQFWEKNEIQALFDKNINIKEIINNVKNEFEPLNIQFTTSKVEDQDWVKLTQSQFNPICIQKKVWIIPSWHDFVDTSAINIIIDPGLAFGTGAHPTTQLCIQWLINKVKSHSNVLDIGCGSGILSITAKKLGAKKVVGADIDSQAIQASKENGKVNKTDIEWIHSDNAIEFKGDLVVANILSSALKVLAPVIANHCKKDASIALSGILSSQENEIKEIYSTWFDFEDSIIKNGWVCISASKR